LGAGDHFLAKGFNPEVLFDAIFDANDYKDIKTQQFFINVAEELHMNPEALATQIHEGFSMKGVYANSTDGKAREIEANRERFKAQMTYLVQQRVAVKAGYQMPQQTYSPRVLKLLDKDINDFLKEASYKSWNVFRGTIESENYDNSVLGHLEVLLARREQLLAHAGCNVELMPPFKSDSRCSLVNFDPSSTVYTKGPREAVGTSDNPGRSRLTPAMSISIGAPSSETANSLSRAGNDINPPKSFVDPERLKRDFWNNALHSISLFQAWCVDWINLALYHKGLLTVVKDDEKPGLMSITKAHLESLFVREAMSRNNADAKAEPKSQRPMGDSHLECPKLERKEDLSHGSNSSVPYKSLLHPSEDSDVADLDGSMDRIALAKKKNKQD